MQGLAENLKRTSILNKFLFPAPNSSYTWSSFEGELLAKDDAALGLRFEAEQSHARAERLQRRLDRLFRGERERVLELRGCAFRVAALARRARV